MDFIKTWESFIDGDGNLNMLGSSFVDTETGELKKFSFNDSLYYPYNELKPYVDQFQKKYSDYVESQGWAIFDSDTEVPNVKYDINIRKNMKEYQQKSALTNLRYNLNYWDIEKLDDMQLFKYDIDVYSTARKMGIIVDEYGVIQGFNGKNLVSEYNNGSY